MVVLFLIVVDLILFFLFVIVTLVLLVVESLLVFAATLIVRSGGIKIHQDTMNSTHDNYSMALSFNHMINSEIIPHHVRKDIFGDDNVPQYFNVNLVVYGRQCVDSLVQKYEERRNVMNQHPIIDSIITSLITESIRLIDEDTLLVCVKHKESFNLNQFTNSLSGSKKDTLKLTGTGLSQPLLCNVVQI